jgi:AmmeMemoRadiSam system protein B
MIFFFLAFWGIISVVRTQQLAGVSSSNIRGLQDMVGFSSKQNQIEAIVALAEQLEAAALQKNREKFASNCWIAAVCPHDDHLLAGRVYVHLFQNLRAKRYVIFGVAHKAANWGAENILVFDNFVKWQGPFGQIKVSFLREEILLGLSKEYYTINDDWQSEEHSVEGIVPFIQYYQRDAEIVSILVPYMNWNRIEQISKHLAAVLAQLIQKHHWKLGEDLAFICSNDGDHYGDQDWGGRNMAPFGADETGYLKATQQDSSLIREYLTGEITFHKLAGFCKRVWGENDLKEYKIRWCGRFAIPFGLNVVNILKMKLIQSPLTGHFLRYDTSYRLGKLPLEVGLGTTAPNHLRHWVGYSAIGYD